MGGWPAPLLPGAGAVLATVSASSLLTPSHPCVAMVRSKAVRPGGLLVLELPHPSDLWGGYCLEEEQFVEAWEAQVGLAGVLVRVLPSSSRRCAAGLRQRRRVAPLPWEHSAPLPPTVCPATPRRLPRSRPTAARRCWWSGDGRATSSTCRSRRGAVASWAGVLPFSLLATHRLPCPAGRTVSRTPTCAPSPRPLRPRSRRCCTAPWG